MTSTDRMDFQRSITVVYYLHSKPESGIRMPSSGSPFQQTFLPQGGLRKQWQASYFFSVVPTFDIELPHFLP